MMSLEKAVEKIISQVYFDPTILKKYMFISNSYFYNWLKIAYWFFYAFNENQVEITLMNE